jgi:hypothetical protein
MCCIGSADGSVEWKDATGQTLKGIQEPEVGQA